MKVARLRSSSSWILAAALLGLLAILATYQYRWLTEVSEAQRERTRTSLERSARLFAKDFDRELTRILAYAQKMAPSYEAAAAGAPRLDTSRFPSFFELWYEVAPFPDLLRSVLHVDLGPSGGLELARYDPRAGELHDMPWPAELAGLKERLEASTWAFPPDSESPWNVLDAEVPAVVLPLLSGWRERRRPRWEGPPRENSRERDELETRTRERRSRFGRGPSMGGPGGRSSRQPARLHPHGYLVFRLEASSFLTRLAERHFSVDGALEFHLTVVERSNSDRVVFAAGPRIEGVSARRPSEDAGSELFGLDAEEARQLMADMASDPEIRRERYGFPFLLNAAQNPDRRWRLAVTHPSGSLEVAVAATRQRNLAIGLGILLVLGTTVVLLLVTTRRAQELARRQIELVAGVTHELRTPLAALRSAGENLADGVVRDPSQVVRYGTLISREGRRLSDMVEQMLEYAGIQSGRRRYQPERTSVHEVIDSVLAESRALLEDKGFHVESDIADDLPYVLAEPAALRRALGNLVGNAVKYGAERAWVAVRARRSGSEVRLSVEDRGQGIAPQDLPHIFEPFYRGHDLSAGRIPGSGLGLSLVRQICEAQGGRVSVSSRVGEGTVFTLHLPAATAVEDEGLRVEACEA